MERRGNHPSNEPALGLYAKLGFEQFNVRKRYYPVSADDQTTREDALVMRLAL